AEVVANANTVRWYSAATGGTLLGTGQVYTASISQNTTVYAEAYNSVTGCTSPTRTPVTLRVNNIYADGPGGVGSTDGNSDLTFWVDPASIVGTTISTWTDKSGKGVNATAASGREPARATSVLNGFDIVRTNGTNALTPATGDDVMVTSDYMATGWPTASADSRKWVSSNPATYSGVTAAAYSIFHVARFNGLNGASPARVIASNNNGGVNWLHGFHATPGVNCFYAGNWVGSTCGTASGGGNVTTWQLHSGDGNRYWSRLTNNGNIAYQSSCGNLSPGGLSIGGWSNTANTTISECADADIAEVITYDRVLNDARKKIVENYLQAKYSTATDLATLTGDIYQGDLVANGNHDYDVAGIGREANGLHLQTRSGGLYVSSTTTDFLKENGDYIMLGRTASTTGWETSNLTPCGTSPNTSSKRLSRVWWIKTTETTANGGNVTLSFNFSDLNQGTPLGTGTYRLLTRANASTGDFTAVTATPTISGNNVSFTVNATTFNTGAQYTLGYDAEVPGAITLNGTNYVEVTNSTDLQVGTGNFTYEFWAYPTATVANAVYFENGNSATAGLMLRQNSASQVGLVMNGTAYTVNYTPALNTWTHFAVVRTTATVALWANGTSIGNFTTAGGATLTPTANLRIGNGVSSSTGFVGMLDEFRYYNTNSTAVSTNQHSNITLATASPAWANLKAYYKFNEPSTTTKIFDLSQNSNNGTLVSSPALTALYPSGAAINGTTSLCATSPGQVYTINASPSRISNYAWSITGSGNSITSTASGAAVTSVTVTWGSNSGTLSCVITHSTDCKTETISLPVTITAQPTISTQPTSSQEACTGATVALNAAVTGGTGNYTYQWYYNTSASTSGATAISGATGTVAANTTVTYTLSASNSSTAAPAGTGVVGGPFYYYCAFTGNAGSNCNANTNFASVTVRAQPSVTLDPVNLDVCVGGSGTMTVTATGGTPSLQYEWEYDDLTIVTDGAPTAVNYSGETGTTLSISTGPTTPAGTTAIGVKVYASGNGCNATYSAFADFKVFTIPTVTTPTPATQSGVCGTPATISVTAGGGAGTGFTYQWYSNTTNSNSGGTPVGTNSATFQPPATVGTRYYYCVVSQAESNCTSLPSATASVTVNNVLTGTVVVDECMNFALGDKYYVLVSGVGGTPPYSYPAAFYTTNIVNSEQGIHELNAGASSTYVINDAAGCSYTTGSVTAPTGRPTDVVMTSSTGNVTVNCWVNNFNKWVTFRDAVTNNAILAIHDNQSNLGLVTVDVYKDATPPVIYNNGLATNCTWTQHTAMRRHFKMTTTVAPTNAVDVMLFFTDQDYQTLKADAWNNNTGYPNPNYACTELDDVYSFNQMYVTKYSGTSEDGNYLNNSPSGLYKVYGDNTTPYRPLTRGEYTGSGTGFQGIYGGAQTHHYVQMSVTEFSEFWLHGSQVSQPLPVDMIFLQADAINNAYIRLTWATAIEINNDGFEVERSTDGQNWSQVGYVDGHDNSTVQNNYSFEDMNVTPGVIYYYRLRQVDNDGEFEYTDIVSAKINGEATFSVKDFVPNPTMDKTSLVVTGTKDQDITVTFYNIVGQNVLESTHQVFKGANRIEFELGKLASGTYTAIVSSANEVYTRKVVLTK
ncbi:MAG TPA: LamG-like jellyroll fold domain-containing protein, partial [Chitinophagales bacterium]|nr:LamG-like jellyroll fold domain-containing protein [Chitinophagales bacterium]